MNIGSEIIFSENLSSTNSYAALLLSKNKLREGTVIQTNFQAEGRGQMGNSWESERDKNLLISIILYPNSIRADKQFILSKVISLGIRDFLSGFISEVFIKWPNDIYVLNDKIAGILIENSIIGNNIESTIAGIGLNINQERFVSGAPNPTSLKKLTCQEYDLGECLATLVKSLDKRYKQLLNENLALIDKDYISSLYRYNRWSTYRDSNGVFEARISDVSETGVLQLEDRKGKRFEYSFKEVDFL
jgi:BirA family transcriptional regulator, biotin operon repressor / biotin---[acetyl-CoA-carboxylase] ligase